MLAGETPLSVFSWAAFRVVYNMSVEQVFTRVLQQAVVSYFLQRIYY